MNTILLLGAEYLIILDYSAKLIYAINMYINDKGELTFILAPKT